MVRKATPIAAAGAAGSHPGGAAAAHATPVDGDGSMSPLAIVRQALGAAQAGAGRDPFHLAIIARALESLERLECQQAALERIAGLHLHTAECFGHMNYATCRRTDSLRHAVQLARDALEG
jgi:hypothetical protein